MDLGKLKDLRLANPFRPFYLILTDGRRLFVQHPLTLGIAPDGSHLMFSDWKDKKSDHLLLSDVKDVDVLPQAIKL